MSLAEELLAEGVRKGLLQGIEQGIERVAKRMLAEKQQLDFINKLTGLPIAKLKELQKSY